jgi:hypothetical protein
MSGASKPTSQAVKYESIPTEEDFSFCEDALKNHGNQNKIRRTTRSYLLLVLVLLALLATAISIIAKDSRLWRQPVTWTSCGNSTAEAIKGGCHFDTMMASWIPNECYIEEPSDGDEKQFLWFTDKNLTQPFSSDDYATGNYAVLYTDASFHDKHCIHTWRKLMIALEQRLPLLDSKTADFHHSRHCASGVRRGLEDAMERINPYKGSYSFVPLIFLECVPLF